MRDRKNVLVILPREVVTGAALITNGEYPAITQISLNIQ